MERNIVAQMLQDYDSFTKSEKKIVDYVVAHRKETQYISITDLSAACEVAVATISVFCRKLSLAGFNDFKLELAKTEALVTHPVSSEIISEGIQEEDSLHTVMEKCRAVNQEALNLGYQLLSEEDVRKAMTIIEEARSVLCLGQGNSSAVAVATCSQFSSVSNKFKVVQDSHLQAIAMATQDERDAVLYFSYSGATNEVMDAGALAKSTGAKFILVTHYRTAPAAEYADAILICGPNEDPLEFGSTAAIISQLYVVDVLLGQFYKHNMEDVERFRNLVGKALMKKQS